MIHFLRSYCSVSVPRFFFVTDMPRPPTNSHVKTTRNKSAPPAPSVKLVMPSLDKEGVGGVW